MKQTSIALWAALLVPACAEGDVTSLLQKTVPSVRRSQHLKPQKAGVHLLETAHTIISKVNAGDDPSGCSVASDAARTALEEELPAIHEQLTHLANQVQIAAQVVENCASQGGDLAQQGIDLQDLRANHQTCRLTEHGLEDGIEVCQQYTDLRNSLENRCFSFPNDEGGFPEAVQQGRDALDVAFNQAVLLREQCNAAREALASQHTECDSAQHQFEDHYCVYRSHCADVQACRVNAEASFGQMAEETQAALETLRAEYQVLRHVECLLGHADQALEQTTIVSGDIVSACSEPANTNELTIDFPVFDALSTCEPSILSQSPCEAYQELPQRQAIEASCTQCPGLPNNPSTDLAQCAWQAAGTLAQLESTIQEYPLTEWTYGVAYNGLVTGAIHDVVINSWNRGIRVSATPFYPQGDNAADFGFGTTVFTRDTDGQAAGEWIQNYYQDQVPVHSNGRADSVQVFRKRLDNAWEDVGNLAQLESEVAQNPFTEWTYGVQYNHGWGDVHDVIVNSWNRGIRVSVTPFYPQGDNAAALTFGTTVFTKGTDGQAAGWVQNYYQNDVPVHSNGNADGVRLFRQRMIC